MQKPENGFNPSVISQVKGMKWNFWIANIIEAGERMAFFGVRAVLPLYMVGTGSADLGLTYSEKGIIYMVWALLQCLIPMISGGYTDSYGYKKSLYTAFTINIIGYSLMANVTGFWTMMLSGILVGTGTAIFKPPVQGAVAQSLDDKNSGLGFGIFYWVVNIGGFMAPMVAAWARGNEANPTWHYVFYGAAIVTAINFLPTIFLFKEPEIDPRAKEKKSWQVFCDTLKVLWQDQAMLRFLLIVSGFWFMFMQLWDLLPNFIDEWIDTRDVGNFLSSLLGDGAKPFLTAQGAAKPEILINIDSFTIILFVLPLSWLFSRYKMMTALIIGMVISVLGFVGSGLSNIGVICALMIFIFAIGEIICSPKFSEYIGMTAPADKKAIYMGYSNIPFAIGWAAGNGISGPLYDKYASRTEFARQYLVEHFDMTRAAVEEIKPAEILNTLALKIGEGTTVSQAKQVLWDTYQPWFIWVLLGSVGVISLIGMLVSYRYTESE